MQTNRTTTAALFVRPGKRLLDIGFGAGGFLQMMGGRFEELHGVDMSDDGFERARGRGFQLVKADLDRDRLPYRDGMFDTVTCLDVLEHVREPGTLLAEAFRVLAPEGQLILSTPNIRYVKHLWSIAVKGHFPRTSEDIRQYDGGHIHYFTSGDLSRLATAAGFDDIRREPIVNRQKLDRWKPFIGEWVIREFLASGTTLIARKPGTAPVAGHLVPVPAPAWVVAPSPAT